MVSALIGSQSCVPPGLAFNSPGAPSKTVGLGIMLVWPLKRRARQRELEKKRGRKGEEKTQKCVCVCATCRPTFSKMALQQKRKKQ